MRFLRTAAQGRSQIGEETAAALPLCASRRAEARTPQ